MDRGRIVQGLATALSRTWRPMLIVLLALVGGVSAWLVVPAMQTASDGTATPVEGWVDGLVPLVLAVIAVAFSAVCTIGSRGVAAFPLLPYAITAVVWAFASGLESGNDSLFAFCLLGMPVLALGGGLFSALIVNRQTA